MSCYNEWFNEQIENNNTEYKIKNKILKISLELIRIGQEIATLTINNKYIDYEFRAEQINQILQAMRGKNVE